LTVVQDSTRFYLTSSLPPNTSLHPHSHRTNPICTKNTSLRHSTKNEFYNDNKIGASINNENKLWRIGEERNSRTSCVSLRPTHTKCFQAREGAIEEKKKN
jgi:hypothetical protein